jgi:hypothetical protein
MGGIMSTPSSAQWQTIESAPHNENILVFSRRWGWMIASFRPEFNAWFSRMQCPAALNDDDADLITHWMPLPARPEIPDRARSERPANATGLPPRLARFLDKTATSAAA